VQKPGDGVRLGDDLEDLHPPAALGADRHVDGEDPGKPPVSAKLSPPPTTNKRGKNHHPDMCKPTTQDPSITTTDEFEIGLEDLISAERPANGPPAQEIVVLIPDRVACTFDRHSHPGALRLRIFVGVVL
jgi:hypothetical protein